MSPSRQWATNTVNLTQTRLRLRTVTLTNLGHPRLRHQ